MGKQKPLAKVLNDLQQSTGITICLAFVEESGCTAEKKQPLPECIMHKLNAEDSYYNNNITISSGSFFFLSFARLPFHLQHIFQM